MSWKIGVDGGGTKTECILVDPRGAVAARHTGPGCSPSLVGEARAREIAAEAIRAVRAGREAESVSATLLCMAGSRPFWKEFGEGLSGCGRIGTVDDSVPVLELATRGGPGLVLHAGTGSFVAARSQDGAIHYAGGMGWRFGDEGSGYDLGRRAVARAILELQGWAKPSGLGSLVRERTGASSAAAMAGHFYRDPAANTVVAALAPDVLRLAGEGDPAAAEAVSRSVLRLLELAVRVSDRLFPGSRPASFRAGVSGHILNHPFALRSLCSRAPFPLSPVTEPPIEGVRLLLARSAE
ncbi:MAG TPA: BadF/BadG/BcrA/BcrD ATPase family protein [Candidatus Sulfotelmatobacter sp.]|nr:BadF/BadG/BcrA/BcrD ATPase family protein [Candidatus Sulfotelmatobacter sp.]